MGVPSYFLFKKEGQSRRGPNPPMKKEVPLKKSKKRTSMTRPAVEGAPRELKGVNFFFIKVKKMSGKIRLKTGRKSIWGQWGECRCCAPVDAPGSVGACGPEKLRH